MNRRRCRSSAARPCEDATPPAPALCEFSCGAPYASIASPLATTEVVRRTLPRQNPTAQPGPLSADVKTRFIISIWVGLPRDTKNRSVSSVPINSTWCILLKGVRAGSAVPFCEVPNANRRSDQAICRFQPWRQCRGRSPLARSAGACAGCCAVAGGGWGEWALVSNGRDAGADVVGQCKKDCGIHGGGTWLRFALMARTACA